MKTAIAFLILGSLQLAGQDMQSCPMHKGHMKEGASQHVPAGTPALFGLVTEPVRSPLYVEKHGDEAMGFPHDKTTHHFRLYSDGGAIEVTANAARIRKTCRRSGHI